MAPWGWECRQKLIKQFPAKPTVRKFPISHEIITPGPGYYEQPEICGGKGFSKIKRAPAYTFGLMIKGPSKPPLTAKANMEDVRDFGTKGRYKIPGGTFSPQLAFIKSKLNVPGPGAYETPLSVRIKRPPAYSIMPRAKGKYQPWDMWTPPPNMYCPPIPVKKPPAYSLGRMAQSLRDSGLPGPGDHDPNFNYTMKRRPAFSFGPPFRPLHTMAVPAPNKYCEKKFMVTKPSIPARTFGIRHSPYLGKRAVYLKPSNLKIEVSGDS